MMGKRALAGWAVAAAAAGVIGGLSMVVAGFGVYQAVYLGLLAFVAVGLIVSGYLERAALSGRRRANVAATVSRAAKDKAY